MRQREFIVLLLCSVVALSGCRRSDIAGSEARERDSALYRKARAAEQSGELESAIRYYHEVLVDEPRSFLAHFQLATLLHDTQSDYIGAIYHYKQYLMWRPESDKATLANERIRIAEQLLAPQILRKVGDSVEGLSQAHLLKENDRLNRMIAGFEGERATMAEEREKWEKEVEKLKGDNTRLREILARMRVAEAESMALDGIRRSDVGGDDGEQTKLSSERARALRAEADALASESRGKAEDRRSIRDKIRETAPPPPPVRERSTTTGSVAIEPLDKSVPQDLRKAVRRDRGERKPAAGGGQIYVVQPGDTLFRVAERFYGDSNKWKRIRDANRANISPDGRIRAGQRIVIP